MPPQNHPTTTAAATVNMQKPTTTQQTHNFSDAATAAQRNNTIAMASPGRFTLDTAPLTSELLEVATRELRETPEIRAAALQELRTLLHNAPELEYSDDDYYLLIFLRPCHFYAESALKLVSKRMQGGGWVV